MEQVRDTINKKSYAPDEVVTQKLSTPSINELLQKKGINPDELVSKNETSPIIIIIEYLVSNYVTKNNKKDRDTMKHWFQILKLTSNELNITIIKHVLDLKGFTETELVEVYNINRVSVNRIVSALKRAGIIKLVGEVQTPYSKKAGKRAKIYLLNGAPPERGHEAQRRYAEILNARRDVKVNQTQLEEAFNLVKLHMDKSGTNRVPDRQIINLILKENGIKGVEIPLLINRLRKEGCPW